VSETTQTSEGAPWRLLKQFLRFFGVALVALCVHYGVMILLVEFFRAEAVRSAVTGYIAGGFASYALNRHFTYDTERSHFAVAWRFGIVMMVGMLLTWGFMALFARYIGWHYLASQIITSGIVLIWNFFAHKYFSFGDTD
jgi:putative flippase GtrA